MLASILVVDSDAAIRGSMVKELRELGHDVEESTDAGTALRLVRRRRPDLMLCDFKLPDLAGVELLSDVRSIDDLRTMRVMMTSNGSSSEDIVVALESGADDFIGKPINMPELRARVGACLRRPANVMQSEEVSAGSITIDSLGHRVAVEGTYISLAPREYRLLLFMLRNQDRVFSRKQLLVHVWDRDAAVGPRTVDVHIRRLRGLLEPFDCDRYIQTVRGSGYRFSLDT